MAHLTRIRPFGFWTFNSVVQPSEFETIDANLAGCITGDLGGTWAPAAPIIIGGSGVQITGDFQAGNISLLALAPAATLTLPATANLSVFGNAIFNSGAICQWQSGSFLTMAAGSTATLGGTTNAAGAVTLSGSASFTGTVTLGAATVFNIAAPRTYTRTATGVGWFDTGKWQPSSTAPGTFPFIALQSAVITPLTQSHMMPYIIRPPDTAVLTEVRVRVKGSPLLGGLPATLARAELYRVDLTTGLEVLTGAVDDPSASLAAYQLAHDLVISVIPFPNVDASKHMHIVRVQGDTGSGGTFGLEINAPRYDFTRAKVGEE